jgi:transposase
MTRYSPERKEAVIRRMMPPENTPVPVLVEETGISDVTGTPDRMYHWRKHARAKGLVVPGDGLNPENWSPEDKFAMVLETATMNEAELAEYCRKKGLVVEQIAVWKENCLQGNAAAAEQSKAEKRQARLARKEQCTPARPLLAPPTRAPPGTLSLFAKEGAR